MSVTEYIGARYVPTFADPEYWNNARTYEPLTIVMHQGNSFTSKQFVPRGIDINNKEFWAETGNYNAQVEAYRQEVQTFNTRINERVIGFNTVADMKRSTRLYEGAICHTNGFYKAGNGGAAYYFITADAEPNEMNVIQLNNGLFAILQITEPYVTPEMFGAWGDGVHDDTAALQAACNYKVMSDNKNYLISRFIIIKNTFYGTCNIIADDNFETISTDTHNGKSAIYIEGKEFTVEGITFRHKTSPISYYNGAGYPGTYDYCAITVTKYSSNISIKNCDINSSYVGIRYWCNNGKNVSVEKCSIISGICIQAENTDTNTVKAFKSIKIAECNLLGNILIRVGQAASLLIENCYGETWKTTLESSIQIQTNDAITENENVYALMINCYILDNRNVSSSNATIQVLSYNSHNETYYNTVGLTMVNCDILFTSESRISSNPIINNDRCSINIYNSRLHGKLISRDEVGGIFNIYDSKFILEYELTTALIDTKNKVRCINTSFDLNQQTSSNVLIKANSYFENCVITGLYRPFLDAANYEIEAINCKCDYSELFSYGTTAYKYHSVNNYINTSEYYTTRNTPQCFTVNVSAELNRLSLAHKGDKAFVASTNAYYQYDGSNWQNI